MEHKISIEFTARYHTLGTISDKVKKLWLVCHGHGHLAQYFIRQFECIADDETLIIAPEGLSRYYLQGFSGRVGATWMTKEDRLTDIENYLRYLEAVYNAVIGQLNEDVEITLFGFSQGAATISRFATQTQVRFHRLILWAGIFPPDLPPLESTRILSDIPVYHVYGTEDQFLTEARIQEQKAIAEQIKIAPEVITFRGRHELYEKVLLRLSKKL